MDLMNIGFTTFMCFLKNTLLKICQLHVTCYFQVGGSNGMEHFLSAVMYNLPIVDCDGMGRAFPEIQVKEHDWCT